MPTTTNEKPFTRENFSGEMQNKTTKFLREADEVELAINASFERLGGVGKISGMSKTGHAVTETTTSTSTSTTTTSSTSSSSTTTMA